MNVASETTPSLIVFGRDETSKAHASVFLLPDVEAAEGAAKLMGMHSHRLEPGEATDIAMRLPRGKLFDSGKAFVPFCKGDLYTRIAALGGVADEPRRASTGTDDPETAENASAGSPEAGKGNSDDGQGAGSGDGGSPDPWAKLTVGDLVLASEGPDEGYFEARITKTKAKGIFTLKFRDYPDAPSIDRSYYQLGLIHPRQLAKR
ncbi:hypothetical protein EN828_25150 [Mesorhizobium sp. M2D.F.Ca.ET.185.01.1.1]|uniref:hypothetical protein n=1 Tax=unclassified Mesorhizobium TaxID=325217 RepID=UPI000FC9A4D7|nr:MULTISPECIES: hypothetical protein [unclassified Mesorhizobium]TGP74340.1 hypothetical protein EN870_26970 [bacterium M00.F.Ca.ET.227.01.1.1]TGP85026.1 hypothetical protein EN864_27075 [bacterium M00.F.Ca.ET.221.01.1.1]TGP89109.1 hypothetical protein EN865_25500 [bacterium M00.F.Ca.ET.222.01.1.1]TGU12833.1 hypothetical protein EN806_15765 [bacterium M00.F.Ca.ET.163.01.1.1]TGU21264.1 hypothetical protein EN799_53835 [bacterium M00.F.Ca.ET.156.01.1.1]TGU43661.1 hypothetical protein EN789_261